MEPTTCRMNGVKKSLKLCLRVADVYRLWIKATIVVTSASYDVWKHIISSLTHEHSGLKWSSQKYQIVIYGHLLRIHLKLQYRKIKLDSSAVNCVYYYFFSGNWF